MIPLRMRPDDAHCGPVALSRLTGKSPAQVMVDWPTTWKNPKSDRWFGIWPIDTPWAHRKYIEKVLGQTMVEHRKGVAIPANSIALVHNVTWGRNLITRFLGALFMQHWVVVLEDRGDYVVVDWGTESTPTRTFTREQFDAMTDSAWPRCIYSIG